MLYYFLYLDYDLIVGNGVGGGVEDGKVKVCDSSDREEDMAAAEVAFVVHPMVIYVALLIQKPLNHPTVYNGSID